MRNKVLPGMRCEIVSLGGDVMIVTETITVLFDPVKEFREMHIFEAKNPEYRCLGGGTTGTVYEKTITTMVDFRRLPEQEANQ